ncbi:alpha-soluble NSF attachment protein-like isoform X2 [Photinus pyralis]|uniref:alpha-soluble NSF attachment protein-like isoform X2 n=1 Tax=Photinus pyralis TaxID=7054 RepID=UPI00126725BD|nr:alpha-soluble NSF attachment protein-like isoform X2 [Photinus pyralis]
MMDEFNENKARQLISEAEKSLSSPKNFLVALFSRGCGKVDAAVEHYRGAANLFKMCKNWEEAGKAFCKAANLHATTCSRHEAASNYVDAAGCYRKTNVSEAVNCLLEAIVIFTDLGRFTLAAKLHKTIAEIYESDATDLTRSVQHYEQASDYFRGEENNSMANKCLLKVAQYAAQFENYQKAIEIYEQIAASSLGSSILKYRANEYFFRAALCHLCVDLLNAHYAIERYLNLHPAFEDTREYKLVRALLEHCEQQNVDAFTESVRQYDSISRLDQWYTAILLQIKRRYIVQFPDLR